jgi:signal transduction histidine kinase
MELTLERFPAYVAHELRTPLATQRALLELALGDPGADLVTWREIGEDVLGACEQQERTLEALLTLSRAECGDLRREPVDLAATCTEHLRDQERPGLVCTATLEPARTTGDPQLVGRLVANLVSNAVRHNVAGGRVDVLTRTAAGRAVFGISNTGPVIPAGELARLFQPFQRLGSGDGAGLGLAIVRAIADAHEAVVSARARLRGGLRVDVAFPALN